MKNKLYKILFVTLFIIGILILVFDKTNSIKKPLINDYLGINYKIELFKKANEYIKDKEINETIELDSKDLLEDKKYNDCNGKVIINKDINDIIKYDFDINCKNDNANIKLKAYTNLDNDYHRYFSVKDNLFGYVNDMEISNAKDENDDEYTVYTYKKTDSLFKLDEDANIINILKLDTLINNSNKKVHETDFGYVIEYNNGKSLELSYYNNESKLINNYKISKNDAYKYLYSTLNKAYLIKNGTLVIYDLKNDKINKVKLLNNEKYNVNYNDGIIYIYKSININDRNSNYNLYKFNLKGELISNIDMSRYINNGYYHRIYITANKDVFTITDNPYYINSYGEKNDIPSNLYIISNDGKLLNTIATSSELIELKNDNCTILTRKNLISFNIKTSSILTNNGNYSYIHELINNNYDLDSEFLSRTSFSKIYNGHFYKFYYTTDNNGTELIFKYE